jgi:hypothetical protein
MMSGRWIPVLAMLFATVGIVYAQSPKDKIAFPIKLNDRLTGLRSHLERGDGIPTKAYYQVFEELSAELIIQLQSLERILLEILPRLNKELKQLGLARIAYVGPSRTLNVII